MSNSINPVMPIRAMDPALNFDSARYYEVVTGAQMVSYRPIVSTNASNSSWTITCPPPSPLVGVHCKVYLSCPFRIEVLASAGAQANNNRRILTDGKFALRAFPIEQIVQNASVRINNNTTNLPYFETVPYMSRYNLDFDEREYEYSCFPSFMDTFSNYGTDVVAGIGSAINPLASYGQTAYGTPRGAFPYTSVYNPVIPANTDGRAVVCGVVTCPIWLSPFGIGSHSDNKCCLIGVNNMDFTFTLANTQRMVSMAPLDTTVGTGFLSEYPDAVNVTFGNVALLFRYLTPKLLQQIPRSINYSYTIVDRYPTQSQGEPVVGSDLSYTSNNIQLNTIIRRCYIFSRISDNVRDATVANQVSFTDTFLPIKSLNISYNNNTGLLSSCTPVDLWNISKKNGVKISWGAWSGSSADVAVNAAGSAPNYDAMGAPVRFNTGGLGSTRSSTIGSIVALDFGIDIGLDDIHAPDEIFNSQLLVKATFAYPYAAPYNCTMYIITCTSGLLTIENLQAIAQIGVLSKEDIVNAPYDSGVTFSSKHTFYGGDLSSSLKKFGQQASNAIKTAMPYVKKGIDGVSKAANAASKAVDTVEGITSMVGLGRNGGAYVGGVNSGGAYVGGKMLSRKDLARRLN